MNLFYRFLSLRSYWYILVLWFWISVNLTIFLSHSVIKLFDLPEANRLPEVTWIDLNTFGSNRSGQVGSGQLPDLTRPDPIFSFGSGQINYPIWPDPCRALVTPMTNLFFFYCCAPCNWFFLLHKMKFRTKFTENP